MALLRRTRIAARGVQSEPPQPEPPQPEPPQPEPPPVPRERPGFVGPLESVLRHPILALLPALLLVGAGVAVGLTRSAEWTAQARINVGRVDVPAYTLQGVTIGNATLAASYARAIEAPAVTRAAGRAVKGVSPDEAPEQLAASQIPGSTLIQVEAEGDSSEQAQRLANAGAGELIKYVTSLNVRQQQSRSLDRFRRAQLKVERARKRLVRRARRQGPGAERVEDARLDLRTAELAARAVANRVLQASFVPAPENLLQLVVPAAVAESDEASMLQRLALIGLVAGLVLGVGLALLRANGRLLRGRRR